MCIAILNTPNVTFPKSLISTCWDNNGDGAGLIWTNTKDKTLHTYRELNSVNAYYKKYIDIRRKHPKTKIVLHFRISTSGGVSINNTHPFSVNDGLAFVHNGVISELNGIDPKRSDTNLFNANILKHLPAGFEQNKVLSALITKFIGSSKLVFLNALNESSIINETLGKSDPIYAGCWFSNTTYKPSAYYDYGGTRIAKQGAPVKAFTNNYGATRKVWQAGDNWNVKAQSWETPVKAWTPPATAKPWEPTPAPAKQWEPTTRWDEWSESDTLNNFGTSFTTYERERLQYLRDKSINDLTADEWHELNNYEILLGDF